MNCDAFNFCTEEEKLANGGRFLYVVEGTFVQKVLVKECKTQNIEKIWTSRVLYSLSKS